VAVLVGRLVFAYYFGVVAGIGHFKKDQMMRVYAQQAGFPVPGVAGWVAGVWLVLGAVSLGLGIRIALLDHGSVVRLLEPATRGRKGDEEHEATR
jgi:uncharacterized membrane protein YphA (DoxX/SURF4 family)